MKSHPRFIGDLVAQISLILSQVFGSAKIQRTGRGRRAVDRREEHYRLGGSRISHLVRLLVLVAAPCSWSPRVLAATAPQPTSTSVVAARPAVSTTQPQKSAADEDDLVQPDSPRASIDAYLRLCRQGQYVQAARYLNVPAQKAGRAGELAKRLKTVLDSRLSIDLDNISPRAEGARNDRIPRGYEEIGSIKGPKGKIDPIRLVQKSYPGPDARWVFSQSVVSKIDDWYEQLDERWFLDHLPPYLLRAGPRNLMIWQWLALPALLLVSWVLGYVLSRPSRKLLSLIVGRTAATWDDKLVVHVGGPLTLFWALTLISFSLRWLGLPAAVEDYGHSLIRGCFLFTFFWVLSRLMEVWGRLLIESDWAKQRAASSSLITLGVRVGKIAVLVIAVIALVSAMGYPAASLLAGLGVGGLAVALAAQKTLEHMFGAFAIGVDQPFREGDFIKFDDITGTVEAIGLRSTRIRTQDRTLISIPNGKLSEMRVESYSARDRMRLWCTIGLVYATQPDQMRQVLSGFEHILSSHPSIWPDNIIVRLKEFGPSALNIEIMAWFLTTDWNEFQTIRQEVLLSFMDCVQRAGTAFAFPTQTVHLETHPVK
jgi:MscS family membrane protein